MSKFSYEEKVRAAQLVEAGETMANAYRQTGISQQVIRNAFEHIQRYGPESLKQHRYDWSGEEKHTILQHMEMNHMSCAETSIQFGIKGSSTVCSWLHRYQRYGMAVDWGLNCQFDGPGEDSSLRSE